MYSHDGVEEWIRRVGGSGLIDLFQSDTNIALVLGRGITWNSRTRSFETFEVRFDTQVWRCDSFLFLIDAISALIDEYYSHSGICQNDDMGRRFEYSMTPTDGVREVCYQISNIGGCRKANVHESASKGSKPVKLLKTPLEHLCVSSNQCS
ncbi:hypothetical protein NA57DRAFT_59048 [Rhizodiscina lignyota]|uniref:Uncharacterized protein n=1 Tax=Rhizodiscina lignyota TaxID=1504668 RepID=A0A9P4ICF6_9PEZI|nr:hypothetical protein NA57DRAFT_59048 [Rhizodiscina lignyota]